MKSNKGNKFKIGSIFEKSKEYSKYLRAISVQQPWAWLIINGYKDIENRFWSTNYRGRLLIHASAKDGSSRQYDLAQNLLNKYCEIHKIPLIQIPPTEQLQYGGIIGEANLHYVGKLKNSTNIWCEQYYNFVLNNIIKYDKMIAYKGSPKIFFYKKEDPLKILESNGK